MIQRFTAVLEKGTGVLGWTIIRVPFDPAAVWPERIRLRVKGSINGHPFRSSLFPGSAEAAGCHLIVNRTMQKATGARLGHAAEFELEPDLEPRATELPEELDALLDEAEGLRAFWEGLTPSLRGSLVYLVDSVKSPEARQRRAEQMAERLLATMEAEVELPPALQRAFRGRPRAAEGWQRMTATQRRMELLGVFYYQAPEARERRIAKLCDAAERRGGPGQC